MARSLTFVVVTLAPGLLAGGSAFAYAVVSAYLLGNCDDKLGCSGGVWFAAFFGGAAFVLSAIGLGIGCCVHRVALRTLAARYVAIAVVLLTALVAVLLLTVPYWAYSVSGSVSVWVLATAFAGWAVVAAIRRLTPNNSFKPTPLRGAA